MISKLRYSVMKVWRSGFGKHLLVTNCVSCGGFFMLGDLIQQRIEMNQNPGQQYDLKRSLRLGLVGLSQGPPHHYWYLYLDKFLPGRSLRTVNKKILADQLIAAPFFAITFIYGAGLLEGNSLSKKIIILEIYFTNISQGSCWSEFKSKFPTIYLFDWFFWPPSQGINFLFVPSQYRWEHNF